MGKKIGRNDPCPCGSGKKYKLCCINKMSEEEIQALYLEQFELTKGLNEANKCHKILDIGKRIIEHQQNSICATALFEELLKKSVKSLLGRYLCGRNNPKITHRFLCECYKINNYNLGM